MRLMHRVGFGYSPNETTEKDEIGQAIDQLKTPAPRVGLRKFRQMEQQIEPWPEKHIYDLETRVDFSRKFDLESEEIEADSKTSNT